MNAWNDILGAAKNPENGAPLPVLHPRGISPVIWASNQPVKISCSSVLGLAMIFDIFCRVIRAIIFDLDGTLADTEPLHFEAFAEVLARERIELQRDDYFSRLIGYNDHDCLSAVMRDYGITLGDSQLQALMEAKAAVYQALIADRDVMCPGAPEFVRQCAARFPLIIATGTLRVEAETILRRANLRDLFLDIIAAEDVEHGKPEPDGFLAALGRLGFLLRPHPSITGNECLAIEDTAAGIESARRAGMRVLALCHSAPASELAKADIVRLSFLETDLDEVLRLLAAQERGELRIKNL